MLVFATTNLDLSGFIKVFEGFGFTTDGGVGSHLVDSLAMLMSVVSKGGRGPPSLLGVPGED